jgi:nucleotide-binding universal stress UspA family protein
VAEIGSAAHWILKTAKRKKSDLIVLTTHGGSPILRNTIGGTTERLLHSSDVPLLVVPSFVSVPPPSKIERIVVPLDGSEESERILPLAAEVASRTDSELLLMHALVEADITMVSNSRESAAPEFLKSLRQAVIHQWEEIEERMRKRAQQIEKNGVWTRMFLDKGGVPEAILQRAGEERASLIAMSAHGYGAFKRMLLGSVASRLLRKTPIPVLLARYGALMNAPRQRSLVGTAG